MKKNKVIRTLSVLFAAVMLTCGFTVTAYAQGQPETETPPPATTEPEKPLTPDGNATLVDDFGGNKQLVTVTTKSGNYFYILIDRDDKGENTVHFLNQVDEADLMALMEDENGKTPTPPPAVCNCTDKCATGKVNVSCPVCKTDTSGCVGKEAVTTPEPDAKPQETKQSNPMGILIVVLVLAGIGGGAFYYFKVVKPKKAVKGNTDLEDFDFDEYDEEEADAPALETPAQDEEQEDDEDTL